VALQSERAVAGRSDANGGLRRALDSGVSSLENTYYALKALVELSHWEG